MRRKSDHHVRNAIQNIAILLLVLSALVLLYATGLPHTATMTQFFPSTSASGTASTVEGTAAPFPVRIASRSSSLLQAWPNETTADDVFSDFGTLLLDALHSSTDGQPIPEAEFQRALENDGIYYDFLNSLPLPVLERTLGGSGDAPHFSARALLISVLQDKTLTLYAWDSATDTYFCWQTDAPSSHLSQIMDRHKGIDAEFAFLCGEPYSALHSYSLIPTEVVSMPALNQTPVMNEALIDTVLTQLEFNVHSQSRYPETNGTEVVVQGNRVIRFAPDGTISYTGAEDSIPLLSVSRTENDDFQWQQIAAAQKLVSVLSGTQLGDLSLHLTESHTTETTAEISFDYQIGGYPLLFPEEHAATVRIQNGSITEFTLHLRSCTKSDNLSTLLPVLQAAAAAQSSRTCELFPGYYAENTSVLQPVWLSK